MRDAQEILSIKVSITYNAKSEYPTRHMIPKPNFMNHLYRRSRISKATKPVHNWQIHNLPLQPPCNHAHIHQTHSSSTLLKTPTNPHSPTPSPFPPFPTLLLPRLPKATHPPLPPPTRSYNPKISQETNSTHSTLPTPTSTPSPKTLPQKHPPIPKPKTPNATHPVHHIPTPPLTKSHHPSYKSKRAEG